MAKRLSENQKEEILQMFIEGKTIYQLSQQFNFTQATISRNLKKDLGEIKYKSYLKREKEQKDILPNAKNNSNKHSNNKNLTLNNNIADDQFYSDTPFVELAPLDYEINIESRKDLSSIPLNTVDFPEIVFMVVDKKIELEIKHLKDYPEWNFLPEEDQKRKTIEIYFDIKTAKKICSKEQKVIKVPNTNIFKIVAPILISRGISRIISDKLLIAL